ncbi:U2 small nuclear ribonucleo protein B [Sodiomyces alkalinus F11]|uniref:U2 small nuclear ribonucleo protein B n=1 Tax=Sodiomyces alkalinus (strain CBS 110278 / VKM F-3762 / F11) TaxID=1314773 RepID=A0A3N2PZ52_SODAK|nr:U2 small nuclear ribonucleo protein B [Sodiomyces alkalinus F11]ROT39800.1 U2 small nuclear ribonucleo protein B [Sodiomyces alkalinus F11]
MTTAAPSRGLQPNASLPAKVTPIPPNQTLYVTNLPSAKIQKSDLRTALYMLFSAHGPVLDIVAMKTMKMRGQAHVTFRDVQTATQAMRTLEGFEFLGRPLKIQYAKSKSDYIAKLDGSYKMPNTGATSVEVTQLQQSIFNVPAPGTAKPAAGADLEMKDANSPEGRGQKRPRDEEEEDSDVAMEEDSDED